MHILYLHQYFCPPGGAGNNRSYELARQWVEAGHQVTLVTSQAYFPDQFRFQGRHRQFECAGINVVALSVPYAHVMPLGQRIYSFLKFYWRAGRIAKSLAKPDIIYASSTPPTVGELGRKLALQWNVPFVFETVDVWPDVPIGMGISNNGRINRWLHRRTNKIYEDAAAIVALSDGMRDQILAHGVAPNKVKVFYNGTNLEAFPMIEREPRAGTHIIYAGTVGRANGAQVIPRLCKALENLGRSDIRCTIVGGGNDLQNVKNLAQELNVSNLQFLDTVPKENIPMLLASADIGLVTFAPFPVLEANSANKFYDYLASGLPVVINYKGWQSGYLDRDQCGLSSQMGDLEGLVANVIQLADAQELRMQMGINGRKLAESTFDRKQIAQSILKLFHSILRK